ncbi:MAG: GNAT family N-acetyltransferase [Bacteroidia bacterium]
MSTLEPTHIVVGLADTDELYNHVFTIRTKVFVNEESVDQEDEYDGFDFLSNHYLAWYDGVPAGAARWRTIPATGNIRLERFAVLKAFRGKGVGEALVKKILSDVPRSKEIFIHAQVHNLGFYEKFGFVAEGEAFEEAGILHRKMVWKGE